MIQKLRRRFIAASMLSLALVLFVLLGAVNLVSYRKTVSDADAILAVLSENQGRFPMHMFPGREPMREPDRPLDDRRHFSPETPFESRFFLVTVDASGAPVRTEMENIAAVDADMAMAYAQRVLSSGEERGFVEDFRFLRVQDAGNIIFLDCGRSLSGFRTTLLASLAISLSGLLAVFLLLIVLSGRIVKPVAESYEKQRRFITDASHEIKTPLTVISADADLLEMELGENEWLDDIRRQTERLTSLTGDLIALSRMDEEKPELQFVEFPMSDVVEEAAQSFLAPARSQGKELRVCIQPMITLLGSEKAIRQLTSILLDNALKYSAEGSEITLRLESDGRNIRLSVSNPTVQPVEREQLANLFDRFFRLDSSRNSATGGHGLGLAIASGIVASHKGKIRAENPDGCSLVITSIFPGI